MCSIEILLVAAALTVSCSEDKESDDGGFGMAWDYANESVYFEVVDKTTGATASETKSKSASERICRAALRRMSSIYAIVDGRESTLKLYPYVRVER